MSQDRSRPNVLFIMADQHRFDYLGCAGADFLSTGAAEHRADLVSAIRNWQCIRTGRHKLTENYNEAAELYDLDQDPDELHNTAPQHTNLVHDLSRRVRTRLMEGRWLR